MKYNAIILEKENNQSLIELDPVSGETAKNLQSDLSNKRKVSRWRLFYWVISCIINTLEVIFDTFKEEVNNTILERDFGQLNWYPYIAKKYQQGYDLVWNETTLKFEYLDTTSVPAVDSRIVKQASANMSGKTVILKLAKGTIGSYSALSTEEVSGFDTYIKKIAPAGVDILSISTSADKLRFSLRVFYNPLVYKLDSSTPQRLQNILTSAYDVEVNIVNFIQSIPFNSKLKVYDLVNAIRQLKGVYNVVVVDIDAKYGSIPYATIINGVTDEYLANAGYLEMDSTYTINGYYDDSHTIPSLTYIAG